MELNDKIVIYQTADWQTFFFEGELEKENNTHFLRVAGVKQPVAFDSLDVITSVGYCVKSQQGTQFRIWANKILKDYLVKWFAKEKDDPFKSSIGQIYQTFDGQDIYPYVGEKAAMLLLMIAESRAEGKNIMMKVVVNLINKNNYE